MQCIEKCQIRKPSQSSTKSAENRRKNGAAARAAPPYLYSVTGVSSSFLDLHILELICLHEYLAQDLFEFVEFFNSIVRGLNALV